MCFLKYFTQNKVKMCMKNSQMTYVMYWAQVGCNFSKLTSMQCGRQYGKGQKNGNLITPAST